MKLLSVLLTLHIAVGEKWSFRWFKLIVFIAVFGRNVQLGVYGEHALLRLRHVRKPEHGVLRGRRFDIEHSRSNLRRKYSNVRETRSKFMKVYLIW